MRSFYFLFSLFIFLFVLRIDKPLSDWLKDVDVRVQYGLKFGKSRGFVQAGDSVVVITGWRQGSGFTNTLRIVYVNPDYQARISSSFSLASSEDDYLYY